MGWKVEWQEDATEAAAERQRQKGSGREGESCLGKSPSTSNKRKKGQDASRQKVDEWDRTARFLCPYPDERPLLIRRRITLCSTS